MFLYYFNSVFIDIFRVLAMAPTKKSKKSNKPTKSSKSDEKVDAESLLKAVKACSLERKSQRSTAREFGVNLSTLQRHLKKVTTTFPDVSVVGDEALLETMQCFQKRQFHDNMVCLFFHFVFVFIRLFH